MSFESASKPTMLCRVCSDKASGFNYSGLSCESCKIFYRRNAYRRDKLKCPRGGCQIDMYTRKCCQKCRLEKCFQIGMQMERIKSGTLTERLSQLVRLNVNNEKDNKDDQMCKSEFSHNKFDNLKQTISTTQPFTLLSYELKLLAEIEKSMAANFTVDERKLKVVGYVSKISDSFNASAVYIRQVIKLCKSISGFKNLPMNDQMILLKNFYPSMITVRAAWVFNPQLDGYPVENKDGGDALFVQFSLFAQYKKKDFESLFRQYIVRMHREMEDNSTIRDLTIINTLFKTLPKLICSEFIKYNELLYKYLLKRYLYQRYGNAVEAELKLAALFQLLAEFEQIHEAAFELYSNFYPGETEEIIGELFSSTN